MKKPCANKKTSFVKYCDNNYFNLNVSQMNEITINFSKQATAPTLNNVIDQIKLYKDFGVFITDTQTSIDRVDGTA